ncbi:MAG: PIN domain-containing protein [Saprospiraceae bacterium]|nr:MAG: PIN domain-containing protein [Saprospiraceae bacterium]
MENLVVDTSIFFSALQSKNAKARAFILSQEEFQLCSPNYLFTEIFKHKGRLLKKSKLSEEELLEVLNKLLLNIHFVNEGLISFSNAMEAFRLCKDIDENDTAFVALTLELGARLWTKDEELKSGLRSKGFDRFFEP